MLFLVLHKICRTVYIALYFKTRSDQTSQTSAENSAATWPIQLI